MISSLTNGGTKMFNFELFTEKIEKRKTEVVPDHQSESYLYQALINKYGAEDINCEMFTQHDVQSLLNTLEESVTMEDEDGIVYLHPFSSFGQMYSLGYKLNELEEAPRHRLPTSFRFL